MVKKPSWLKMVKKIDGWWNYEKKEEKRQKRRNKWQLQTQEILI